MFRIAGLAFVAAVLASWISDGNQYVIGVAFFGVIVLFAWSLLSGRTALKCPNCGKRVKIGYTTCHHCGAAVGRRPLVGQKYASAEITKNCDHCLTAIPPLASVCPQCQRDVTAWTLHDGTWWEQVDGAWHRLNLHADPPVWELFQEEHRVSR